MKFLLYLPAVCMLPAFAVAYVDAGVWLDCQFHYGEGPPCGDGAPAFALLAGDPFVWLCVATLAYVAVVYRYTRNAASPSKSLGGN